METIGSYERQRICRLCRLRKPLTGYYPSNKSTCKTCVVARSKEWRIQNPEAARIIKNRWHRGYYARHRGEITAKYRAWYHEKYGKTPSQL